MKPFKPPVLFDKGGDLSKRWYVGYYFLHPETGKYILFQDWISTKLKTARARRKAAQEKIDYWEHKLLMGYNPFAGEVKGLNTIVDSVEHILKLKQAHLRRRSISTLQNHSKHFMDWLYAKGYHTMPVELFGKNHVQQFFDFLILERGLSPRTHNNYFESLRNIFNELEKRDYIVRNPFRTYSKLPVHEPAITAFSNEELILLRDHLTLAFPELWLFCQFIFYCALRPAEIVRIKCSDIDLVNRGILINSSVSKNGRNHVVGIPPAFAESLVQLHIHSIRPDHFIFSTGLKPGPTEIYPTRAANFFRAEADKLGIPREKRMYDLKHTIAGILVANGANLDDIKKHFRHHDIGVTDQYIRRFRAQTSEGFLGKFPNLSVMEGN